MGCCYKRKKNRLGKLFDIFAAQTFSLLALSQILPHQTTKKAVWCWLNKFSYLYGKWFSRLKHLSNIGYSFICYVRGLCGFKHGVIKRRNI